MARYEGFAGTAIQHQIIEPKLDEVAITTADSTECILTDAQGETITSTTLSYTASLPNTDKGGWFGNINLPATPQKCHIHSTIVKSGASGKWHDTIQIKDFV